MNERDLDDYAYSVDKAVDAMRGANAQVDIVIRDACRANPFESGTRALGDKGLAPLQTQGVYISYAAADGQTASDNLGGTNGLYTQELLKNLAQPGLNIDQMFKQTRLSVWKLSDGKQTPYVYDGLFSDDFYFKGQAQLLGPGAMLDEATGQLSTRREPIRMFGYGWKCLAVVLGLVSGLAPRDQPQQGHPSS